MVSVDDSASADAAAVAGIRFTLDRDACFSKARRQISAPTTPSPPVRSAPESDGISPASRLTLRS